VPPPLALRYKKYMEEIKSKKHRLKNKICPIIIIVLLITVGILFYQKEVIKGDLIYYKFVPHIELKNTLNLSSLNNFRGQINGFVLLDNKDDQPKKGSQYYIIEPLQKFDNNSNQIFSLDEMVALWPLPAISVGKVELTQEKFSSSTITLEDNIGNLFFIDKLSKKVTIKDINGDSARLITDYSEYRKFILDCFNK
jgi:hypothetical protein